jgi:hypothetical protein
MHRSMIVKYVRALGRTIAMYQTSWHRADGSLAFRELVDLDEVVWG